MPAFSVVYKFFVVSKLLCVCGLPSARLCAVREENKKVNVCTPSIPTCRAKVPAPIYDHLAIAPFRPNSTHLACSVGLKPGDLNGVIVRWSWIRGEHCSDELLESFHMQRS